MSRNWRLPALGGADACFLARTASTSSASDRTVGTKTPQSWAITHCWIFAWK